MRLGIVVPVGAHPAAPDLARAAAAAEKAGIDVVLVEPPPGVEAPIAIAALLSGVTSTVRVVAAVEAGPHPVALAEEAAVADLGLNGRLVVQLESDDLGLLAETIDVVFRAGAARPFRYEGQQWIVPARLPTNREHEELISVLPRPAALELPIWVAGAAATDVACTHGVAPVSRAGEDAEHCRARWTTLEERLGPGSARLRRVAIRDVEVDHEGAFDSGALTQRLRAEQRCWGLDLAILRVQGHGGSDQLPHFLHSLSASVRPRLELGRLPAGLDEFWSSQKRAGGR